MRYPFTESPPGQLTEVADGVLWARLPMPFRLNHVNVFLIRDGGGWTVVDTGLGNEQTKVAWQNLLAGPLAGQTLRRVIATHHHPDHIGVARWLHDRFGAELLTSETTYLNCAVLLSSTGSDDHAFYVDHYTANGMNREAAERVGSDGRRYLGLTTGIPKTFRRLTDGADLTIGDRRFIVISGDGHAPEQIMLYCADDALFLAADQVMSKITPNVSVTAVDPDGDPLGLYIDTLSKIIRLVSDDALVLPGHQLPFVGLHERCRELLDHHHQRCELVLKACHRGRQAVADLVSVLFPGLLDSHETSFAFTEAHAHANYLLRLGLINKQWDQDRNCHAFVIA